MDKTCCEMREIRVKMTQILTKIGNEGGEVAIIETEGSVKQGKKKSIWKRKLALKVKPRLELREIV